MIDMLIDRVPPSSVLTVERRQRLGVSLLELMLVIALLSVIAAISFPAFRKTLIRNELTTAARQLQQDLQRARLNSMETGVIWIFLPSWDSHEYFLGPLDGWQEIGSGTGSGENESQSGQFSSSPEEEWERKLPLGLNFITAIAPHSLDPAAAATTGSRNQTNASAGLSQRTGIGRLNQAVLIYPTGRMTSFSWTLINEEGYQITLEIQGLAGRIKLGPVTRQTPDESSPWTLLPEDTE